MWPCGKLPTCPGLNPASARRMLGQATGTASDSECKRSCNRKWMLCIWVSNTYFSFWPSSPPSFFLLLFFQMMHLLTQHPPLSQKLKFQSNNSWFLFFYWPLNRVITEVVLLYRWQCAFCFSLQIPSLMVSCSRHQAHCMFTNDKWQTLLFRARKGIRFTKACGLQRLRAQGPPL